MKKISFFMFLLFLFALVSCTDNKIDNTDSQKEVIKTGKRVYFAGNQLVEEIKAYLDANQL